MAKKTFNAAALNIYLDDAVPDHPAPPADALVKLDDGTLEYRGASLSRVGLSIPAKFGKDQWHELGTILSQIDTSLMWWVGDWMAYGEKLEYGEAETAAQELGINIKNLYDYTYVSSNVTFSVRTENLSWSHHKLVAKFEDPDEQRHWLNLAEHYGWTRNQLKQAIREHYTPQQSDRAGQAYKKTLAQISQIRTSAHEYTPNERAQLIAELRATANALESL